MAKVIYGSEMELAVLEPKESSLWVPGKSDQYVRAQPETLARLLRVAADLAGVTVSPLERVHLTTGTIAYIDGDSFELATPPCSSLWDLALHEVDCEALAGMLIGRYREKYGKELQVYIPGTRSIGEDCGYHENYGLPAEYYFRLFHPNFHPRPIWDKVLLPFLVSRIVFSGGGGFVNDEWVISPRAAQTTHVYHHSTQPQRPIVHLKRPKLGGDTLRIQLTCNDMLRAAVPTIIRFASTGVMLMAAASGMLDDFDFTLQDPLEAVHMVARDHQAVVALASGQEIAALDLQDIFAREMNEKIPQIADIAPSVARQAMQAWAMT